MKKFLGDEGLKLVILIIGLVTTLVAMKQFQDEGSKGSVLWPGVALSIIGMLYSEIIFAPENTPKADEASATDEK